MNTTQHLHLSRMSARKGLSSKTQMPSCHKPATQQHEAFHKESMKHLCLHKAACMGHDPGHSQAVRCSNTTHITALPVTCATGSLAAAA